MADKESDVPFMDSQIVGQEKKRIEHIKESATELQTEGRDAWLTAAFVFVFNVLIGVNSVMFSVLYVYFTDYFESDKATIGWIGSIQKGVTMSFGIVMSPVVNRCGCRTVAFVGSLIYVLAILLSSTMPSIWCLFITFGLLAGCGLSMMYLSGSVVIQKIFHRNRTFAGGIALLGSSLGNMIGPIIIESLVAHYGWRGALVLISGLQSHLIPVALMFPTFDREQRNIQNNLPPLNNIKHTSADGNSSHFSHILDLCNFSLMKNSSFVLFCISFMILMFNTNAMYDHLIGRAVTYGIAQSKAAYLVSSISLGIVFTRIICSFVANLQCSNCLLIYTFGSLLGAVTSLALTFMTEFLGMVIVAIVHGVHLGFSYTVVTVCAVYMVGTENITGAQGFLNFFYGFAGFVTVPLTGWIYEYTKDYNMPFYVTGSVALLGTTCSFSSYLILHCTRSNQTRK